MNENKKSNYPTQIVLSIRAIVGAYVLYQAYLVATSKDPKSTFMWIAVVVIAVCGFGFVVTSILHFIRGEYEGGKADTSKDEIVDETGDVDTMQIDENQTEETITKVKAAEIIEGESFQEKAVDFRNVENIETVEPEEIEELD